MSIERLQMPRYGTSDPPWPGLPEGGRLVTVTGANVAPENPAWTDSFKRLQEQGRVVFSAAIEGGVHAKHGTNIDTRLTVIDRVPADDNVSFPTSPGIAPALPTLLGWVIEHVPPRRPVVGTPRAAVPAIATPSTPRTVRGYVTHRQLTAITPAADLAATEVAYARHRLVVDLLRTVGVPAEAAEADAEGMEYHVSDVTLKAFAQFLKSRGWLGGIRALCPPAIECCASGLIHRIQQLQDRRQCRRDMRCHLRSTYGASSIASPLEIWTQSANSSVINPSK
jgi:Iron dependent repressor, metal binding and dimerisation domain